MKTLIKLLVISTTITTMIAGCQNQSEIKRSRINFDKDWRFNLGDAGKALLPDYDDSNWRLLNLPHDWSIEGEFSRDNPATPGGGALPGGIGWYRKNFTTQADTSNNQVYIDFDGIYRNSEVWINGHNLGLRPYGYISFRYDLTPYLNSPGQNNVIAVRVDNSKQPNSRWYSGSGIYRNVWLVTTRKVHVYHWGTFITTDQTEDGSAKINISVKIENSSEKGTRLQVINTIYDNEGNMMMDSDAGSITIDGRSVKEISDSIDIAEPHLWSVEDPYLYSLYSSIEQDGKVVDEYMTHFGIRYFRFDIKKGFLLNGKTIKIRGVCNHHDLGCLGAAVNTRALERQLKMLKDMGCNAIRTSHNPPAPELLDLCDRMGFLVMDEAFDMWKTGKTRYDYHLDWDDWHKKDLQDMVLRDRNHPSVIIWSIGNEIMEQHDSSGVRIARELAGIVHDLDTSRPVTSALNETDTSNFIYKSGALDLVGFNYHEDIYKDFPVLFPGQKFIASETTSALATRGHYDMPSDSIRVWPMRWDKKFTDGNPDYTCSAYDNCHVPWGSTHEKSWNVIKYLDFASGMFIWTGFDYLGEPTPYWWPARSSYFGIIDLAGFPKDAYYMYQSEWTDKPVLHIFPHWNWQQGDSVDVWAYFNTDEVELFLNGKSLGTKKKTGDKLHVMWRVAWEPGTIKAIGRTKGKEALIKELKTAGKPAKIILIPDRKMIKANGRDLSFVTVKVVDTAGTVVPHADNLINFEVSGNGYIAGVDNGSQSSHEPFKASYRKAMNGLCLAVIQSKTTGGKITLKATSMGLAPATLEIMTE